MVKSGSRKLKMAERPGIAGNGWKKTTNCWKWLEVFESDWKCQEMADNGCTWLSMAWSGLK